MTISRSLGVARSERTEPSAGLRWVRAGSETKTWSFLSPPRVHGPRDRTSSPPREQCCRQGFVGRTFKFRSETRRLELGSAGGLILAEPRHPLTVHPARARRAHNGSPASPPRAPLRFTAQSAHYCTPLAGKLLAKVRHMLAALVLCLWRTCPNPHAARVSRHTPIAMAHATTPLLPSLHTRIENIRERLLAPVGVRAVDARAQGVGVG